jgi:hypothetical protein
VRRLLRYLDPRAYVAYARAFRDERATRPMRRQVERRYAERRTPVSSGSRGVIVCEGMWDNPNHFFRLGVTLAALPERGQCRLLGVLRRRSQRHQRRTLESLGVTEFVYLDEHRLRAEQFLDQARALLRDVASHRDLLRIELPDGFPAYAYYDTVLKIARDPRPPLTSPLWLTTLAEVLRNLAIYAELFGREHIMRVLTSHPWKNEFATLCWTAIHRAVPCQYVTGFCEATRIRSLTRAEDFATPVEHLPFHEFLALPAPARARLVEYGTAYLAERERGTSSDINTRYAFRPDLRAFARSDARRALGVPLDRPLVAVYSQVWFDFPHTFGMQNFTDFLDWIRFTAAEAARHTHVTWLLKPHPCDPWYGSLRLADVIGAVPAHVRLCPEATDSLTVQLAADAVVTVHGTIGIEAAARGLPVLCADRSYYSDWEFSTVAKSREDYAALLSSIDTLTPPTDEGRARATAFAALALAPPPTRILRTSCDTSGPMLYGEILDRLDRSADAVAGETAAIAQWLAAGHSSYAAYQTVRWAQRA